MRRRLLLPGLALAICAACKGAGYNASPTITPTCTPPTQFPVRTILDGTNASAGKNASFRVLVGTDLLYCGSATIAAGGTFHFEATTQWLEPGDVVLELVLDSEAGPVFGAGDRHYNLGSFPSTSGGSSCDGTYSETRHLDAIAATQSAISWSLGRACPGT